MASVSGAQSRTPACSSHKPSQNRAVLCLRKRKLLTQVQLAERSGVGVATIIRVERNQVEPRESTIRQLAEALGVEPEELVKAEG